MTVKEMSNLCDIVKVKRIMKRLLKPKMIHLRLSKHYKLVEQYASYMI